MKLIASFFSIFLMFGLFAQKNIFLHLTPKFGNSTLQLNTNYTALDGATVNLNHFMYYVSEISVVHDGGQVSPISPTVFLVKPDSFLIYLGNHNFTQIEQIEFTVGVPKFLNTQNGAEAIDISGYPENHPLSFQSPSMYWGWQAGYMHMIVGGSADPSNQVPANNFELHNLGINNNRNVLENVIQTNTTNDQIDIYFECHLEQWLRNLPLATVGTLHGENGYNITVMQNVDVYPVFVQPVTAQINSVEDNEPQVYTFENKLFWTNSDQGLTEVYDLSGKKLHEFYRNERFGSQTIPLKSGSYLFTSWDAKHQLVHSKMLATVSE